MTQCTICPRECDLKEGQTGACGARHAAGDKVVPVVPGILSAIHLDPIEKKPLNHFYPGTTALSLGSFGCNLFCKGCQNHEISRASAKDTSGFRMSPAQIVAQAKAYDCPTIAYTYNEPIIWAEFVEETALAAHEAHLNNVMVTAGYVHEKSREKLFAHIDAANVDLKGFTEDFYQSWTGAHLQPVLDTLEYLNRIPGFCLEITTLLIPGMNDKTSELEAEFAWIAEHLGPDIPLHLSAFHPDYKATNIPCTPIETLLNANRLAKAAGLHYVYLGNVRIASDTICPACHQTLIKRMGYMTQIVGLKDGKCSQCNHDIYGKWNRP